MPSTLLYFSSVKDLSLFIQKHGNNGYYACILDLTVKGSFTKKQIRCAITSFGASISSAESKLFAQADWYVV